MRGLRESRGREPNRVKMRRGCPSLAGLPTQRLAESGQTGSGDRVRRAGAEDRNLHYQPLTGGDTTGHSSQSFGPYGDDEPQGGDLQGRGEPEALQDATQAASDALADHLDTERPATPCPGGTVLDRDQFPTH